MLWRKIKPRRRVGKGRAIWITEKKYVPGTGNSNCKGPGVESSMARTEQAGGGGEEVGSESERRLECRGALQAQ